MGPYSHYVLAAKLKTSIRPEDAKEYFWGAVAPDIRYLANIPRDQTHLELARIRQLKDDFPHLKSFLSGYRIHILIDQFEKTHLYPILSRSFPFRLLPKALQNKVTPRRMKLLVEMFYLQTEPVNEVFSGEHNEVLSALGITPEQSCFFYQILLEYFDVRSFEAAITAYEKMNILPNSTIGKYQNAYEIVKKRQFMNHLMTICIRNARIDARVIEYVRSVGKTKF